MSFMSNLNAHLPVHMSPIHLSKFALTLHHRQLAQVQLKDLQAHEIWSLHPLCPVSTSQDGIKWWDHMLCHQARELLDLRRSLHEAHLERQWIEVELQERLKESEDIWRNLVHPGVWDLAHYIYLQIAQLGIGIRVIQSLVTPRNDRYAEHGLVIGQASKRLIKTQHIYTKPGYNISLQNKGAYIIMVVEQRRFSTGPSQSQDRCPLQAQRWVSDSVGSGDGNAEDNTELANGLRKPEWLKTRGAVVLPPMTAVELGIVRFDGMGDDFITAAGEDALVLEANDDFLLRFPTWPKPLCFL
ncbi:hypothetical protein FA15DRAFT_661810 [Coprinopsis marcescibilis]|uniref:Uncharacterized protein n=1 Tax=Coprinopsis marcescibilis TaxID=230819 RepID=A0A5C3KBA8_COPMA|nr:hypothetical protein FA15DRAFT_661810 [Coprinopsis marcescibilis]